jgi:hypothetical protein
MMLVLACNQTDQKIADDDPVLEKLRGDFQFTLTPETGRVTCLVRFTSPHNGLGKKLTDHTLLLDGQELVLDSTEMNGYYYEADFSADSFFHQHEITLKGKEKAYKESFQASRFTLPSGFPSSVSDTSLTLPVEGVEEGEKLLVNFIDTAFNNNDLHREYLVENGKLNIPSTDMLALTPGPVSAEILYEQRIRSTLPLSRGVILVRQYEKGEFLLIRKP